jgi:hypothetical protein
MNKNVSKLLLLLITISLIVSIGCKKKNDGIDITNGTWAFALETVDINTVVIYDFRGDLQQGSVYYRQDNRGTYTVSGDILNFTVNHYGNDNSLYLYTYSGIISDYYHISGSFYVTNPDGSTDSGTFTAER